MNWNNLLKNTIEWFWNEREELPVNACVCVCSSTMIFYQWIVMLIADEIKRTVTSTFLYHPFSGDISVTPACTSLI